MRVRRNPLRKRFASTRITPVQHIHLLPTMSLSAFSLLRHLRPQRDLRMLSPTSGSVGRGSRCRTKLHAEVHILRLDRECLLDDKVVRRLRERDIKSPEYAREDELCFLPCKGTTLDVNVINI